MLKLLWSRAVNGNFWPGTIVLKTNLSLYQQPQNFMNYVSYVLYMYI